MSGRILYHTLDLSPGPARFLAVLFCFLELAVPLQLLLPCQIEARRLLLLLLMASYLFNIWHAVGCFSLTMFVALSLFVPEIFEPIATRLAGSRMSSYLTYLWDG